MVVHAAKHDTPVHSFDVRGSTPIQITERGLRIVLLGRERERERENCGAAFDVCSVMKIPPKS